MLWLVLLSLVLISAGASTMLFVGMAALFGRRFNSPYFARSGVASLLIGLAMFVYVLFDLGII